MYIYISPTSHVHVQPSVQGVLHGVKDINASYMGTLIRHISYTLQECSDSCTACKYFIFATAFFFFSSA